MAEDILYKPHMMFEHGLQKQYHEGAEKYFDNLVTKTKTDVELNRLHVKEYKKAAEELATARKKLSGERGWMTFFIVFTFLLSIVGFILFILGIRATSTPLIVAGVITFVLGLSCIFGWVHFHKASKAVEATIAPLKQKADMALQVCYGDMAPLNADFDWNMPSRIMESATPLIDLDEYFSSSTLAYLVDKFNFPIGEKDDTSVLGVISGHIQGNPFVLEKVRNVSVHNKAYTGSITITWTTVEGTGKDRRTVTHTQTLTATTYHPAPFYHDDTRLIYANEAAPHLHFSRSPSNAHKLDEHERRKAVEKGAKELAKKAQKAVANGGTYMTMGNDEFEVFFGGSDRDNEVEFRLLFTPLAQKNELELLEDPTPFGDDFYMVKDGMINSVASAHSQGFDYNVDPSYFEGYDVDEMRTRFVAYCDAYIKGLYYDLAPLLSIPLYQLHKSTEYIYKDILPGNYTSYEQEAMANGIEQDAFIPKEADPSLPLILKADKVTRIGATDDVLIKSYSYKTTPMIDYVSKMGNDGRMHTIPVHWIQYDLRTKQTPMVLKQVKSSRKDYREILKNGGFNNLYPSGAFAHFERGLITFVDKAKDNQALQNIDNQLSSIFSK